MSSIKLIAAVFAAGLLSSALYIGSAAAQESHHYVIELKDVSVVADKDLKRELRDSVRDVKRISDSLPRSYKDAVGKNRKSSDLRRWRVIEIKASELSATLEKLKANPAVLSLRPEKIYHAAAIPNDPSFSDQYSLNSVYTAWGKTKGSGSTVIAIIDAGVDAAHEDLQGKMWTNSQGYNGWDFVEDKPATYAHKHGTHVAGIAAAASNNGKGITGIDWNAKIMSVRALNRSGYAREEWIVQAIDYAANNGADIINLSIAGSGSELMQDAIENAYARGVIVVAAAGNSGANTDHHNIFPVCADKNGTNMVIGVGASDDDREGASFSNYGKCVDVSAPGKRIVSTTPGNKYKSMSGTSMSSPYIAGAVGLYLSQHPGASTGQVIGALKGSLDSFSGRRAARDNERLKGIVNLARLVGAPLPTSQPNPAPAPGGGGSGSGGGAPAGEPVLTVSLAVSSPAIRGKTLVYTASTKNSGSASAQNVKIEVEGDRDAVYLASDSTSGCQQSRYDVICDLGSLEQGKTKEVKVVFSLPEDELRCGERIRSDAEVTMLERGRDRRQSKSSRITSEVTCQ